MSDNPSAAPGQGTFKQRYPMLSGQHLQVPRELYVFAERLGLDGSAVLTVMGIEHFRRYRSDWHMTYEDIAGVSPVSRGTVKRCVQKLVKRGLLRCERVYYRGNLRGFAYDTEPLWNALAEVAREEIKAQSAPHENTVKAQSAPQIKAQSAPHALEVEALEVPTTTYPAFSISSKEQQQRAKPSSSMRKRATKPQREFIEQLGYECDEEPRPVNTCHEAQVEIDRLKDLKAALARFADDDEWGDDEKVYRIVLSPEMEAIQNGRANVEPAEALCLAGTATAA